MLEGFITGYVIDENGFWTEETVAVPISNDQEQSTPNNVITFQPSGELFFKMKWTGDEWIEGESLEEKEERESQQLLESLKPNPSEIADAELEIKMITMLTEMGVIQ